MNILFEFYLILSLSTFILSQTPDSRLEPNLNISIPYVGNDPDKILCENLYIDATVRADDGIDYIFKDDYYWQLNRDYTLSPKFAEPINKRWPQLPTPLDAAFTLVDKNSQLSTVFIKDNQWFLYKGNQQLAMGNTKGWDRFPNATVKAAFTYFNSPVEPKKNPVYFLYNIDNYIKYETQNINDMKYNASSKTFRTGQYFYFLQEDDKTVTISLGTLDTYITNISAVLSNQNDLLFFGVGKYCRANITEHSPECNINDLDQLFKCPRMARPTTTTTTTSTMATIPEIVNSTFEGSVFETTFNGSNESQTNSSQPLKSQNEKSSHNIWYIIILIIIVVVVICLVVFFVIKIFKKNKTNSLKEKSSSNSSKVSKSTVDSNSESLKKTSQLKDEPKPKSLKSQSHSDNPEEAMSTKGSASEAVQTIEKLKT